MRLETNRVIAVGALCLAAGLVTAIAHQEFSWWVFPFGLLFGTMLAGILGMCCLTYRENRFRSAAMTDYPGEPWMWDARWRSAIMRSRSESEFWGALAFTLMLSVFAGIGIASMLKGLPEGNLWVLLNVLPLAGAVYLGRRLFAAWRVCRLERQVSVTNETRPAWVGARFSAAMEVVPDRRAEHVEARLEHFKVVRREESDGVAFEKVVDRTLPGQTESIRDGKVKISVDIPEKSPTTSWDETEQNRWWDLVITMIVSGNKFSLRYEVPVADPADSPNAGAKPVRV